MRDVIEKLQRYRDFDYKLLILLNLVTSLKYLKNFLVTLILFLTIASWNRMAPSTVSLANCSVTRSGECHSFLTPKISALVLIHVKFEETCDFYIH